LSEKRILQEFNLILFVVFSFFAGFILLAVPWIDVIWNNNYFVKEFYFLRKILLSNYFRGMISSLGLLNFYCAIEEFLNFFLSEK